MLNNLPAARHLVGQDEDASTDVMRGIVRVLEGQDALHALTRHNRFLQRRVAERTAELAAARMEVLLRLSRAAEYRDDDTGEHTKRVGRTSAKIARGLALGSDAVEMIGLAAPLHDIGKIGIPDSILLHGGRLTAEQFEVMKTHCVIGHDLLDGTGVPLVQQAAEIALTHHERWDGTGYPQGLRGENIPLVGRVVAVADTWDALTHPRRYKDAWSRSDSLSEIRRSAGSHLDPRIVEVFVEMEAASLAAAG